MKKTIILILVILLVSLVSAEEGCYLYKESMLYCLDLEKEEATGDCMIYDKCVFEKVFFEGKSCIDLNMFPECEEIFCKSTCDYELLGKCWGGKVPLGEESIWCSSGCCRFEYYGGEFCMFKKNKWLCEIEAMNKDVEKFNFEAMAEGGCKQICSQPLVLEEMVTEGLIAEEVIGEEEVPPTLTPEEGINWIWIVLVLILLLVVSFLLYQKYKPKKGVLVKPVKKRPRFFIRGRAVKKREERIRKLREEMEKKIKERERGELFRLFGLDKRERKLTHVDLLEKVTKAHELRDRRRFREEDIFRKLDKFVKELKEKEKKKLTEKEAKDIFKKLRKIVEKKK